MKFKFVETDDKEEVVVYAKEKNELVLSIEEMCALEGSVLIGYDEGFVKRLNPLQIECFFTLKDKVYALFEGENYLIKKRLYELNELYKDTFIYINQGCLVNLMFIDKFDIGLSGALVVILKSGYKDYASRRQIKNIKERLGLKWWKK